MPDRRKMFPTRRGSNSTFLFFAVMLVCGGLFSRAALAEGRIYPPIFGTREISSTNLKKFPKWMSMLQRNFDEEKRGDASCVADSPRSACIIAEWKAFIVREQGHAPMAELGEVNAEMNKIIYRLDPYYWETPREFTVREGDCKDYAIAKYFTLRKLGWSADDLRVVVLRDMDLAEDHAIVVAYLDGKSYSLDNLVPMVLPTTAIHHYRPYYSINESHWWLHIAQ
jgi:predicted transglutaminase-like cysteine proteinase